MKRKKVLMYKAILKRWGKVSSFIPFSFSSFTILKASTKNQPALGFNSTLQIFDDFFERRFLCHFVFHFLDRVQDG